MLPPRRTAPPADQYIKGFVEKWPRGTFGLSTPFPPSVRSCPTRLPEDATAGDDILDHLVLPQVTIQLVTVELHVGLDIYQQPRLRGLRRLQKTPSMRWIPHVSTVDMALIKRTGLPGWTASTVVHESK